MKFLASPFIESLIENLFYAGLFVLPFSKSAAEVFFMTSLFLWLIRKINTDRTLPRIGGCRLCYGLFLAFTLFSIGFVEPEFYGAAFRGFAKWLKFIGIFFLSFELCQREGFRKRLAGFFLLSLIFVVLNGFYQMAFGTDLIKGYSVDIPSRIARMKSSFQAPNMLSAFLLIGIPLVFSEWLRSERWNLKSALQAVTLGLFSIALLLTFSRSAFFAIILSGILYAGMRKMLLGALAIVFAIAVFVILTGDLRANYMESLNLKDITIGERFRYWQTAGRMIQAHPLRGIGVNLFHTRYPDFREPTDPYQGYAHNSFLQIGAEIGLPGLAVFCVPVALFLSSFITYRLEDPTASALAVGLTAFLIQSFFDTHFHSLQPAYLFWVFWGMIHALQFSKPRAIKNPSIPMGSNLCS